MKIKLTLVSALFIGVFSIKSMAQITTTFIKITVNGNVKSVNTTDFSGISVKAKSYYIGDIDIFRVDTTVVTDGTGTYSFNINVPIAFCSTLLGCYNNTEIDVAAIPLYLSFTKNNLNDTINENIPLSTPYKDFSYTISKTPLLGGYLPQIKMVTVDTTFGVNKNMIIWQRKDDPNIVSYTILKSLTFNGKYDSIGNVLQSADYSVYRDQATIPGQAKTFYKIEAVYSDKTKSPLSYPKAPLNIKLALQNEIPNLSFINKEDIPLFDHGIYKSISILRADGNSKVFTEFKKFDFTTNGDNAALLEMLSGWADSKQTISKCVYLLSGELKNTFMTDKPNMLKSDSGPFSQSLSNLAESQLTSTLTELNAEEKFVAYPNPSKGIVSVSIPEDGTLSVVNTLGETINSTIVSKGVKQLDIKGAGIYSIILKSSNVYITKVAIE